MPSSRPWSRSRLPTSDPVPTLCVTLHPSFDRVLSGDCLRPNDSIRTRLVMEYCGGKGNNAARALARLGVDVTATGFQGGLHGQIATNQLAAEGVTTRFVICDQPTRISTMLHEEDTGFTYAIYEPGQRVSNQELKELMDLFEQLVSSHECVLLCGSAQTATLQAAFSEMISMAQAHGIPSLLDSSGEALKLGVSAKPYLVKVNQRELEAVLEKPLANQRDQIDALSDLCRTGIHISAMSIGEQGLIATDGREVWHGALEMQDVINTVGCGDSTLAGMAYALTQKAELPDIVRWGTACGAANTRYAGAGFITTELVNTLFPLVQLEKLA
jgi:tagatose 6-phosphate kinase